MASIPLSVALLRAWSSAQEEATSNFKRAERAETQLGSPGINEDMGERCCLCGHLVSALIMV